MEDRFRTRPKKLGVSTVDNISERWARLGRVGPAIYGQQSILVDPAIYGYVTLVDN